MNVLSSQSARGGLCAGSILALCMLSLGRAAAADATNAAAIRTPKAPATPRINGPAIFGVRPGSPLLYRLPATGDRPMEFSVKCLPAELRLDAKTGEIAGSLKRAGETVVTLRAKNAKG